MKIKRTLISAIIITMSLNFNAFAHPIDVGNYTSVDTVSKLLPLNVKSSRSYVTNALRGVFFAAGELTILNDEGRVRAVAKGYMVQPVDEVYMTIYVDRLENNVWHQVAYYDFEFFAEDYPDGLLEPGVDFTIKDGAMEGFGPVTEGILIE